MYEHFDLLNGTFFGSLTFEDFDYSIFFSLLVADKATEDYYRKLDVIISHHLPNIVRGSSVTQPPPTVEPDSARPKTPVPEKIESKVSDLKIEEDDDEGVEEEVDEVDEVEQVEAKSASRRLSSRSSSSSAEKVRKAFSFEKKFLSLRIKSDF